MSMVAPLGITTQTDQSVIAQHQAKYGANAQSYTYVPYLGMHLKGDHSNGFFGMPDAKMYYANQALAMVTKGDQISNTMSYTANDDPDSKYKRGGYSFIPKIHFEYTAALKKQQWIENEGKKQQMAFIANGGQLPNMNGVSPYIASRIAQQLSNPYQASVPPGGADMASNVVGPLTQIPFIQDVLGFPTPEYHINDLTTKVALPQLHAEQPETDWGTPNLQLEPTQFVENRRPDFDSHFFLAKRNEFAFIIPREYRYRATIDPYNIYVRQASDGLRQAREALTLLALSELPDQATSASFVDSGADLVDPTADTTGGYPAAKNNSKSQYERLFSKFWKNTRGQIDSIVMNPVDFVNYESNFFSNGWQGYNDVSDWGILQMPGFKRRIRVSSSPFAPEGILYFFNSRFVFTGEGPMTTETWAKPEANSDAGAYRDYVDVRIFNSKRAGFKAKFSGTFADDITTLTKARDLIKPPSDLLEKNQS